MKSAVNNVMKHPLLKPSTSLVLLAVTLACAPLWAQEADTGSTGTAEQPATPAANAPAPTASTPTWSQMTIPEGSAQRKLKSQTEPGREWAYTKPVQWIAGLALTAGNEDLPKVTLYEGVDEKGNPREIGTIEVDAGGQYYVYGGALIQLPTMDFRTQVTLGYHFTLADDPNGNVCQFSRVPIDIIPVWEFQNHRVGLGLTYHTRAQFDTEDAGGDIRKYEGAIGTLVSYQYKLGTHFSIGGRYTAINYREIDGAERKADGTNLGLFTEYVF